MNESSKLAKIKSILEASVRRQREGEPSQSCLQARFSSTTLAKSMIWQESQFNEKMRQGGFHRYSLKSSELSAHPYAGRTVIIVLTTQRSGSTLLCDDLGQYLGLPYKPTETFIPVLQNYFRSSHCDDPEQSRDSLMTAFSNALSYASGSGAEQPVVHKLMIDYMGWLSCAAGIGRESSTYVSKCESFLRWIFSGCSSDSRLILLKRRNLSGQAVSRFINSMGYETHLTSEHERASFEAKVKQRLSEVNDPAGSILEHAVIIHKQNKMIDSIRKSLHCHCNVSVRELWFESDVVGCFPGYLPDLAFSASNDLSRVSRSLVQTSGVVNKSLGALLRELLFPS